MDTKTYHYNGHLIVHDEFRYRVPSAPWGDQAGEVPSFKTLTAAKAYIDRRNAEHVEAGAAA